MTLLKFDVISVFIVHAHCTVTQVNYQNVGRKFWWMREGERWVRLGNDYRALIVLENWWEIWVVVRCLQHKDVVWLSGKGNYMTWSYLFQWLLPIVPAIFLKKNYWKEEPLFIFYDYIINTHKYSYFPVDPKFWIYPYCGFPVSLFKFWNSHTVLVPARTCIIMTFQC